MNDQEVEWEDAEPEDWDVLIDEDDIIETGYAGIEISIDNPDAKKKNRRAPITKAYRQHCLYLHRVHLLVLLSRTMVCDEAASNPQLQAQMLSLLTDQRLILEKEQQEDMNRALAGLANVVHWFRDSFSVAPSDIAVAGSAGKDLGPSFSELTQQVVQVRAGPEEALVACFVALLRGQGLLVRFVRLLDVLPTEPWHSKKAVSKGLKSLSPQEARAKEAAREQRQRSAKRKCGDKEDAKELNRDDGEHKCVDKKGFKQRKQLATAPAGGASSLKKTAAAGRRAAAAAVAGGSGEANRVANGQVATTQRGNANNLKTRKQGMTDDSTAAAAAFGAGSGGPMGSETSAGMNRGQDEYERELQLALMATAAEAEARSLHRLASGSAESANKADTATATAKRTRKQLLGKRAKGTNNSKDSWPFAAVEAAQQQAAVAGSSAAALMASTIKRHHTPTFWAEVYCGSVETGRWVHVDVLNGLVNKPDSVAESTQRSSPAAYVVACMAHRTEGSSSSSSSSSRREAGPSGAFSVPLSSASTSGRLGSTNSSTARQISFEIKDVTKRYVGSMLQLQKWRDGPWWEATMTSMFGAGGHPSFSAAAGAGTSSREGAARGGRELLGTGSGRARAGPNAGAGASSLQASRAAVRARREDDELHQRASSQLQGLPSSIDGFKVHPLYVLQRHIGKYEAIRPGSTLLGTHRGEPFFARSSLSALHSAMRWPREGREVRPAELSKPFKEVKKRKVPAPQQPGKGASSRRQPPQDQLEPEEEEDIVEMESGAGDAGSAGKMLGLFGEWQTDPWERPQAMMGRVPRNAHGNVEVPPLLPELPLGTVHVSADLYPGVWMTCRDLGVDFAPALIGFELQRGRMLPKIDGVVVCEEFEELVVTAYLEKATVKNEVLAAKRRKEARAAWLQVLQAMRMRMQLRSSYEEGGDVAAASATVEAPCGDNEVLDLTQRDSGEEDENERGSGGARSKASGDKKLREREEVRRRLQQEYAEQQRRMASSPVGDDDVKLAGDSDGGVYRIDAEEF